MKKSISLSIIILSIIFTSCKKESKSSTPSTGASTGTPTLGIDAEVYAFKEVYLDNMGWPTYSVHAAIFYASPFSGAPVSSVNAGTVNINGSILKVDVGSIGPYYIDTTNTIASSDYTINVSGSSQFPAGSLQYGQNYPAFNDTNAIPSVVQLSTGLSLQFNNCLNTDSIGFTIDDGNTGFIQKKYAVTNNQVHLTVSSSELSTFVQSTNGTISVDISKSTTTPVGTKKYLITLEKRYHKVNVQFN